MNIPNFRNKDKTHSPSQKTDHVSMFSIVIAASGERKTSVESAFLKGLSEFESRKAKRRGGAK